MEGDWEHQESRKEGPRRREEDAFTIFPLALGWEPVLGNWPWTFSGKKNAAFGSVFEQMSKVYRGN